jgi:hypothetical protein
VAVNGLWWLCTVGGLVLAAGGAAALGHEARRRRLGIEVSADLVDVRREHVRYNQYLYIVRVRFPVDGGIADHEICVSEATYRGLCEVLFGLHRSGPARANVRYMPGHAGDCSVVGDRSRTSDSRELLYIGIGLLVVGVVGLAWVACE